MPPNSKDVFSAGNSIGIVFEDKVNFYDLDNTTWQERPDLVFDLPNNCKAVFSPLHYRYINVIIENKIIFYIFDEDEGVWKKYPINELEIPINCQGVFADEWGSIFVITDNKIKIFAIDDSDEWSEYTELEFDLPGNFNGAIYQRFLGIVNDNKINYYFNQYQNSWIEISNAAFNFNIMD